MIAIQTRYHGATNTRGSRISATDGRGNRVSIPFPYDSTGLDVHAAAAEALCDKMGWRGELVGGGIATRDGDGDKAVWCFLDSDRANVGK